MRMDPESQMGLLISKYLDNETTTGERELVEKHLSSCGSCHDVVQIFRRNDELLKSSLNVEIFGNQIVEQVMGRLDGGRKPLKLREILRRPLWAGVAAALAVVGLSVVVLVQHSILSDMSSRFETLTTHVDALDSMRDDLVRIRPDVMKELAVREAIHKFEKDPGTGILASVLSGQIHLSIKLGDGAIDRYQIYRRVEKAEAWGNAVATTINREFTDSGAQPGQTYEYRVVALDTNGISIKDATVKVAVPSDLAAMVQDLSGFLKISFLLSDSQAATVLIQRKINGQLRTQSYQVKVGQELGSRVPDLTGTQVIDFRTGYQLAAVIDEDQTIGVTSNGNHFTRVNKKLVLKPAGRPNDPGSIECWLGGEALIPLPK